MVQGNGYDLLFLSVVAYRKLLGCAAHTIPAIALPGTVSKANFMESLQRISSCDFFRNCSRIFYASIFLGMVPLSTGACLWYALFVCSIACAFDVVSLFPLCSLGVFPTCGLGFVSSAVILPSDRSLRWNAQGVTTTIFESLFRNNLTLRCWLLESCRHSLLHCTTYQFTVLQMAVVLTPDFLSSHA